MKTITYDETTYKLVPIEPTETMIIHGFESDPKHNDDPDIFEKYHNMSGCQRAAWTASECYKAMIEAAPDSTLS